MEVTTVAWTSGGNGGGEGVKPGETGLGVFGWVWARVSSCPAASFPPWLGLPLSLTRVPRLCLLLLLFLSSVFFAATKSGSAGLSPPKGTALPQITHVLTCLSPSSLKAWRPRPRRLSSVSLYLDPVVLKAGAPQACA